MRPNRRDEAILQFLADKDIALPPTPIYENLRLEGATFSQRTVRRRLKQLHENEFVEKILGEKGYYRISEKGRAYLAGELDLADT
ncbi:Ribonuclease R winged-helix domain-containing protein [Halogranum gelatinilyticum]|uniref:Ribonuclease R winged-helix domain-containing protein n=1 Tax=Halogranum gelatinilyticum TaxID=660521 RepID=A0A1G9TGL2_9EURY|nr:winged-helix domain-containing protein [Halogranum gelatinilyticum]SDM46718.1 Ribonuclease R winged-helix domain-containing protein [Halogranum gelatinilyticum]